MERSYVDPIEQGFSAMGGINLAVKVNGQYFRACDTDLLLNGERLKHVRNFCICLGGDIGTIQFSDKARWKDSLDSQLDRWREGGWLEVAYNDPETGARVDCHKIGWVEDFSDWGPMPLNVGSTRISLVRFRVIPGVTRGVVAVNNLTLQVGVK